jgi:hypothetical protein
LKIPSLPIFALKSPNKISCITQGIHGTHTLIPHKSCPVSSHLSLVPACIFRATISYQQPFSIIFFSRRCFIRKSKHQKHPNNVIIEGRFGIVVLKATTAISNFLTMGAVADGS